MSFSPSNIEQNVERDIARILRIRKLPPRSSAKQHRVKVEVPAIARVEGSRQATQTGHMYQFEVEPSPYPLFKIEVNDRVVSLRPLKKFRKSFKTNV